MSCQPPRDTSGQSNSGHKQIRISKLFSHNYISTVCQVKPQNQSLRKHKTYIYKHQTQIFEELVPLMLPLLKEHIRLGHAGYITCAIWQQAAHTTNQLSSPSCSTRAIQRSLTLIKIFEFSAKKPGEWTISRKITRQKEQED